MPRKKKTTLFDSLDRVEIDTSQKSMYELAKETENILQAADFDLPLERDILKMPELYQDNRFKVILEFAKTHSKKSTNPLSPSQTTHLRHNNNLADLYGEYKIKLKKQKNDADDCCSCM